jgi:hypothetical protein
MKYEKKGFQISWSKNTNLSFQFDNKKKNFQGNSSKFEIYCENFEKASYLVCFLEIVFFSNHSEREIPNSSFLTFGTFINYVMRFFDFSDPSITF